MHIVTDGDSSTRYEESVLEVSVNDAVVVEVVDGIEDGPYDGDSAVLGKLAL